MKSKLGLTVIVMVALFAVAGAAGCGSPSTAVQQEKITVTRGDIVQSVNADGSLSLPQQRKLSFGVDGKIVDVKVEEGAKVTKGQVLARLDTSSVERAVKTANLAVKLAEADRQQAEAAVLTAQADLKQAENGVKTAEADLAQAENGVKTASANFGQAGNSVKTAENDLDSAANSLSKISYPYTFTTFNLNIPAAVQAVHDAQLNLSLAKDGLSAAAGTPAYTDAWDRFNKAVDSLTTAQQNLLMGTGIDNFLAMATESQGGQTTQTPVFSATDYWTLKDAQLGVDRARLGVDTARQALDIAGLAVDTANSVLSKAQLGVEGAKVTVDRARAGVTSAQAALSKAQSNVDKAGYDFETASEVLDKAVITAPFDGLIAEVDAKTGDVLTPLDYSRTIFQIIDPRRMEFTIKVDEVDILGVEVGQEANISMDAVPGFEAKGKVLFVSPLPVLESGVVQYPVKVGFDVPAGVALKSGMSSNADIVINQHKNALLVPNRAVSGNKSGKPVVKLLVNGQAEERVVVTGISNSLNTEILSGLNEGDTVIIEIPAK